jgi:amino acid adenylation domain-containing protein
LLREDGWNLSNRYGLSWAVDQFGSDSLQPPIALGAAESLGALFRDSATRYAARNALWVDGTLISYAELLTLASRIAHALKEAGLGGGGERCAVLGNRGLIDFAGVLGASLARATFVPLNVRHPPQRLVQSVHDAGASALVVDNRHVDNARTLLEAVARPVLVLLPDCLAAPDWAARLLRHRFLCRGELARTDAEGIGQGRPDDGAYLLFTSGSTGVPKGVLVRNRNIMPYLGSVAARYAPSPEDRCTQLFGLNFDLSVHDMFTCWSGGGTLFRVPDSARFAPRDFVRRHKLTVWFSVPSTAAMMLGLRALRPDDFPSLRLSLFCGEALPKRVALAWAAAAPNSVLDNLYGPTECTVAFTAYRIPRDRDAQAALPDVIPIGAPLAGQRAAVVEPGGAGLLRNGEGELCLAGSQVTGGYWRRPDLTAERFLHFPWDRDTHAWYRTGDRVRPDAEHGLLFLGRLDRQVKIAGHRVELEEVEAALSEAADGNAAAIAWPLGDDGLARGIIGFIGPATRPIDGMLDACRRKLPPYAVPSALYRVADWPRNSSGKTDYRRLRELMETSQCRKT